jgi:hypothetical protein
MLQTDEHPLKTLWRPVSGWLAMFGVGYAVLSPLASWIAALYGLPALPELSLDVLIFVATSLLGLGTMRTAEKMTVTRTPGALNLIVQDRLQKGRMETFTRTQALMKTAESKHAAESASDTASEPTPKASGID